MTPLEIKECDVAGITFKEGTSSIPCFRKGGVTVSNPAQETFLDVSGWGMGEVWMNGQYLVPTGKKIQKRPWRYLLVL